MLECQADNGGCGELELAACAELRGAAPICSDIDECATDNGGCDDGFICINHDGLQGEPNECIDRDECVGSVSGRLESIDRLFAQHSHEPAFETVGKHIHRPKWGDGCG